MAETRARDCGQPSEGSLLRGRLAHTLLRQPLLVLLLQARLLQWFLLPLLVLLLRQPLLVLLLQARLLPWFLLPLLVLLRRSSAPPSPLRVLPAVQSVQPSLQRVVFAHFLSHLSPLDAISSATRAVSPTPRIVPLTAF